MLQSPSFFGPSGERTLFMLDCVSGIDISPYSDFPEDEVLLMPGSTFVVEQTMPPALLGGVLQVVMRQLAPMLVTLGQSTLAAKASKLATEINIGIQMHGVVQHNGVEIYAYEVDGASVPAPACYCQASLVSWVGFCLDLTP